MNLNNLQHCTTIELPIIGYVRSPLSQKFGIPRQPNLVQIPAVIEFVPPYDTPLAFEGLEQFSHIWLIWQFHHNKTQHGFKPQVRPPRLGGNEKIGVFATRSMYRPANIGLSVVQLDRVEHHQNKMRLHILGADMVDGTPILDIKPYITYSDSWLKAKSGFATSEPVQKPVMVSMKFSQAFLRSHQNSLSRNVSEGYILGEQDFAIIQQLIAQDPRPAYRQDEINTRFIMRYKRFDIVFFMDTNKTLIIDEIIGS